MATPAIHLDTAESDPRSHQGIGPMLRDVFGQDAIRRFARPEIFAVAHPLPLGATPRTDVEQSGVETSLTDLSLRDTIRQLTAQNQELRRQLADADTLLDTARGVRMELNRRIADANRTIVHMAEEMGATPPFKHIDLSEPIALEHCGELGRRVTALSRAYRVTLRMDTADTPDVRPTSVTVSVLVPQTTEG